MTTVTTSKYFIIDNIPIDPVRTVLNLSDEESTSVYQSQWMVKGDDSEKHSLLHGNRGQPLEAHSPLFTQGIGTDHGDNLSSSTKHKLSLKSNQIANLSDSRFSHNRDPPTTEKSVDNEKAYRETLPRPKQYYSNSSSSKNTDLLSRCHSAFSNLPQVKTEQFRPEKPKADPKAAKKANNPPKVDAGNEESTPILPAPNAQIILTKEYMGSILNWMENSAQPLFDDIDTIKLAAYIKILRNVIKNTLWEEPLALELSVQLVIMRETLLENISNAIKQLQGEIDNPNEDYYVEDHKVAMIENFDEPEHMLAKAMNKYYDFGCVQANGFAWVGHCSLLMLLICISGLIADVVNKRVDTGGIGKLSITYLILLGWGVSMYGVTFLATLWDITPVYVSRLVQLLLGAGAAAIIAGLFMGLQGVIFLSSICLMSYTISLTYKKWNSDAECGVYIIACVFSVVFPIVTSIILDNGGNIFFFWFALIVGIKFTANFERTFIGLSGNFRNINKFTWSRYTGFASMGVLLAPMLIGVPITIYVVFFLVLIAFFLSLRLIKMAYLCIVRKYDQRHNDNFIKTMDKTMIICRDLIFWVLNIVMTREYA